MQIKRALPLALVLLSFTCSSSAYSQTRKRPNVSTATPVQKRRVILDLVTQEPIAADFIQADAASITVEINGARRVFRMDEVVSIIFSPDEANRRLSQSANRQGSSQVQEALKAVRKLNSAIGVGITLNQYSELLVEAKASVDEALATLPAGELKEELTLAMQAYVDAGQVWNVVITNDTLGKFNWRKRLAEQYQIPEKVESNGMIFRPLSLEKVYLNMVLNYIWNNACAHLDRASSLNQ